MVLRNQDWVVEEVMLLEALLVEVKMALAEIHKLTLLVGVEELAVRILEG
jgi:hypothetical protein